MELTENFVFYAYNISFYQILLTVVLLTIFFFSFTLYLFSFCSWFLSHSLLFPFFLITLKLRKKQACSIISLPTRNKSIIIKTFNYNSQLIKVETRVLVKLFSSSVLIFSPGLLILAVYLCTA